MIIHLTGPDTFRSHRRLQQLRQAWREKFDIHGFNTVTVDGQTATIDELRTAVQTTGLFSAQRFVAVDDYVASGAACSPADLIAAVERVANSKDTVVVIREIPTTSTQGKGRAAAPLAGRIDH